MIAIVTMPARCSSANRLSSSGFNGVFEDGGMTIFEATDYDQAARIATDDPTVKSGMLNVEVKTFWVPFHR